MRIKILGAGWYGCHIAKWLISEGHDVHVFEPQVDLFQGASGKIPARLHIGSHYPRSYDTREACQRHTEDFMREYGFLTAAVQTNIYAIAEKDSLVDYRQYVETLRGEFQFIEIYDPAEYGLQHVEGAIIVPERHILADRSREFFREALAGHLHLGDDGCTKNDFHLVIDCTFGSQSKAAVDRYEPCIVLLLKGPTERAVTIMDGPFGSLYPWDPDRSLCSLSSALHTPFRKDIKTYDDAKRYLDELTPDTIAQQAIDMFEGMAHFYPAVREFDNAGHMLSIRAMPRSGADTRLVSVSRPEPDLIRVRAGKIDAVLDAQAMIAEML